MNDADLIAVLYGAVTNVAKVLADETGEKESLRVALRIAAEEALVDIVHTRETLYGSDGLLDSQERKKWIEDTLTRWLKEARNEQLRHSGFSR